MTLCVYACVLIKDNVCINVVMIKNCIQNESKLLQVETFYEN